MLTLSNKYNNLTSFINSSVRRHKRPNKSRTKSTLFRHRTLAWAIKYAKWKVTCKYAMNNYSKRYYATDNSLNSKVNFSRTSTNSSAPLNRHTGNSIPWVTSPNILKTKTLISYRHSRPYSNKISKQYKALAQSNDNSKLKRPIVSPKLHSAFSSLNKKSLKKTTSSIVLAHSEKASALLKSSLQRRSDKQQPPLHIHKDPLCKAI